MDIHKKGIKEIDELLKGWFIGDLREYGKLMYSGRPKVETFCSAHKLEKVSTFGRFCCRRFFDQNAIF